MDDVLFNVRERGLEAIGIWGVVEIQAAAQEMRRAVRGKKLDGAGHRALQVVQHPTHVSLGKVKLLSTDPRGLHFMGKHHLMGILDERSKLRFVVYRH